LITLALGDPTIFGNLDTPDSVLLSVIKALQNKRNNGYAPSSGLVSARKAIAMKYSSSSYPITENDVYIASGCSGAITLAVQALANPGDNVLLPRPGFSLYATVAGHSGIQWRYYNLLPETQWECDLKDMASKIDDKTRCIVINNPSNPTGSNYSKQHLLDILDLAKKYKIPILSDEIYGDMVFEGETYYSLDSLSEDVPILACGGIAKRYCVPGWRVGWVLVHDRHKIFGNTVHESLQSLSQLILGANTIMQAAIPEILQDTKESYYQEQMQILKANSMILVKNFETVPGLKVVIPQGAMYFMVEVKTEMFKDIGDDQEFAQKLLTEEFVFVLPGSCFQAPNFFRVVTCAPKGTLVDACHRIAAFCSRHLKEQGSNMNIVL